MTFLRWALILALTSTSANAQVSGPQGEDAQTDTVLVDLRDSLGELVAGADFYQLENGIYFQMQAILPEPGTYEAALVVNRTCEGLGDFRSVLSPEAFSSLLVAQTQMRTRRGGRAGVELTVPDTSLDDLLRRQAILLIFSSRADGMQTVGIMGCGRLSANTEG